MGSGSLRYASAVTALLCSTKGTAPGEPIKSVRCAGDSCSGRSPESLPAPHHWWGNTVELAGMGRGCNRESRKGRRDQWRQQSSWKHQEITVEWGVGATVWLQVEYIWFTPAEQGQFHEARLLHKTGNETKMDILYVLIEMLIIIILGQIQFWSFVEKLKR